jgi:hypothetical protein
MIQSSAPPTPAPPTPASSTTEVPDILKRPEAVIIIVVALWLTFWDAYLELIDDLEPENALSSRQLAQRLGVDKRSIRRKKRQPGFSEWTQTLDPDGIAWGYEGGVYAPKG